MGRMARQVFRRHFLQAAGGVIIPVIEKIARVLGKAFMGNGLLYSQRKPAAAAPDAFQAVFQLTPGNKGRVIPHQSQIPGGSAGQAAGVAVDGPAGIKGMGKGIDVAAGGRPQFFQAGDGAFDDAGFRFEANLKKAQVGIAMGGIGSDIAVDAADIALINDDIRELPHLVRLSRRMMLTIKCNLTFSMALNFIAIILAITGALNPVVGALVHNAGSVLVIVNSALLLKWKAAKS